MPLIDGLREGLSNRMALKAMQDAELHLLKADMPNDSKQSITTITCLTLLTHVAAHDRFHTVLAEPLCWCDCFQRDRWGNDPAPTFQVIEE